MSREYHFYYYMQILSLLSQSQMLLILQTTASATGIDEMTKYIIIACSVGGVFILAVIIGITICCCKRKKHKPRQVKYILKPPTTEAKSGEKPAQVSRVIQDNRLTLPHPVGGAKSLIKNLWFPVKFL